MAQVKSLVGDSMGAVKQSAGQAQQANESLIQSFGFMKTAIGGVGVGLFISQVKAGRRRGAWSANRGRPLTNRMKVASGRIGDAGRELDYVRGMANRMGLSLLPAMDGYPSWLRRRAVLRLKVRTRGRSSRLSRRRRW